ncbi:hypothetical protein [Rhizorhabdus argentea]|uniref:hypothetical protein n=1 Tax=Rhizorhabdus argentea TaxID=1387174 RepID=UPI0030EC4D8A
MLERPQFSGYLWEMSAYPKMQLSRLREIGWKYWDPIGLANSDGGWDEACADEYDEYLLHIVSLLRSGQPAGQAVAYLDWASSEDMGLGHLDGRLHLASVKTVEAVRSYLKTLTHKF